MYLSRLEGEGRAVEFLSNQRSRGLFFRLSVVLTSCPLIYLFSIFSFCMSCLFDAIIILFVSDCRVVIEHLLDALPQRFEATLSVGAANRKDESNLSAAVRAGLAALVRFCLYLMSLSVISRLLVN